MKYLKIYLDWSQYGVNICGSKLTHLRLANDLVLFAEALESMLGQLRDKSVQVCDSQ